MLRELDSRQNNNLRVTLMWRADNNTCTVVVYDEDIVVLTVEEIPGADASYAFAHPYAYSGPTRKAA